MEMKASGKYVSRGLSFKDAEFEHVVTPTKDQRKMYDDACGMISLIQALRHWRAKDGRGVEKYMEGIGASTSAFKLLCISMKVPEVITKANEALARGHCVVIGLQTTENADGCRFEIWRGCHLCDF